MYTQPQCRICTRITIVGYTYIGLIVLLLAYNYVPVLQFLNLKKTINMVVISGRNKLESNHCHRCIFDCRITTTLMARHL